MNDCIKLLEAGVREVRIDHTGDTVQIDFRFYEDIEKTVEITLGFAEESIVKLIVELPSFKCYVAYTESKDHNV